MAATRGRGPYGTGPGDDPTRVNGAPGPPRRALSAKTSRNAEPRIAARDLGRKGQVTPFARLARTHLLSVAGDALITVGLAQTIFFQDPSSAPRGGVALYLLLTLAPFALASPFIGPLLDRAAGGRRWMVFGAALARAVVALMLIRDLGSIAFYFEAFLMLVLSKVHLISKSALLPTTVRNDAELVEANSKLSLLGALAAVVAGGPGLALAAWLGPEVAVGLAMVVFLATAAQAFALPDVKVAAEPAGEMERAELRGAGIQHALQAMALIRFGVGFLTFLIAFAFRVGERPNYWYLVVALTAQAGFLIGSGLAPLLRRKLVEEQMLMVAVGATFLAAAGSWFFEDLGSAALITFGIGVTASVAKQAFDALVQRDAPDANRGRSFAKFEARFQLVWVVGAFLPVVLPIPMEAGFLFIAGIAAYALISYIVAYKRVRDVATGKRDALPVRDPRWRRLMDVLRERRRNGGAPRPETVPATGFAPGPNDATLVVAQDGDPTTVDLAPGDLQGPGLFGVPDAPVPSVLLEQPSDGLFADESDEADSPEEWQLSEPQWGSEPAPAPLPAPEHEPETRDGDAPGPLVGGDAEQQPQLPGFDDATGRGEVTEF